MAHTKESGFAFAFAWRWVPSRWEFANFGVHGSIAYGVAIQRYQLGGLHRVRVIDIQSR
jgi:hypothetical protein